MGTTYDATVEIPHYSVLKAELEKISSDKKLIAKVMSSAVRYAATPTLKALEANVSRVGEVTGNLKRAVAIKAKAYNTTGNAVSLVGYIKPGSSSKKQKGKGKDRASHAHFVEYGTKNRLVKGNIASSYLKRGIFGLARTPGGGLKTGGYPRTFFKKGKVGQPLSTGAMPVGGRSNKPPVEDAYDKTKSQINARLIAKTDKAIEQLTKAVKKAQSK